jgi:hypothetical protein
VLRVPLQVWALTTSVAAAALATAANALNRWVFAPAGAFNGDTTVVGGWTGQIVKVDKRGIKGITSIK